jgi:TPR repeat protein
VFISLDNAFLIKLFKTHLFIIFFLLLSISHPLLFASNKIINNVADYYNQGMKYYMGINTKKDPVKAHYFLSKAAYDDYLPAQFQLAILYEQGVIVIQNDNKANFWLKKSSESGYSPAQHHLATRLITGQGIPLNQSRAIFWLNKAAEQYDLDAMRDLGFIYFKGLGVNKNLQRAHDLLLSPAEEGSALAQYLLGEIYKIGGDGITKNRITAQHWWQKADALNYQPAILRLTQVNKQKYHNNQTKRILSKTPIVYQYPSSINKPKGIFSNKRLRHDAQRIQAVNQQLFTLQIISVEHYRNIAYLTDQYLDNNTYLFKVIKEKNQELFILTYGLYQNRIHAKQAIKQLPTAFQLKSYPWIRQLNSINHVVTIH